MQTRRKFLKHSSLAALGLSIFGAYPRSVAAVTPHKTEEILVIGSGVTALCLAAMLAKIGKKVCVLEAHPTLLGGHSRTLTFQGLTFSGGPEYSWNFGEGKVGQEVLAFLGLEKKIPFVKMNEEGFERIMIEGRKPFDVPMGLEAYQARLIERFPTETKGIKAFFQNVKLFFRFGCFLHDKGLYMKNFKEVTYRMLFAKDFSFKEKQYLRKKGKFTLREMWDDCGVAQEVRDVLYGYGGIFLENSNAMSFALYSAGIGYYQEGAYYPKNGYVSIIQGLAEVIKQNGGEIYCNQKVTKLEYSGDKITAVHTQNQVYQPQIVISALSPRLTYKLIERLPTQNFEYQPSNTVTTFFVGIEKSPEIEQILKGRSIWWRVGHREVAFETPNIIENPAMIYLASTSAKGYGGIETMTALTIIIESSFAEVEKIYREGEEAYQAYKQLIQSKTMQLVEKHIFSNFQAKIKFCEVFTPYDCFLAIGAENGNSYGKRLSSESIAQGISLPKKFKNLTIACATIGLPGIAVAFNTAKLLFQEMTQKP